MEMHQVPEHLRKYAPQNHDELELARQFENMCTRVRTLKNDYDLEKKINAQLRKKVRTLEQQLSDYQLREQGKL